MTTVPKEAPQVERNLKRPKHRNYKRVFGKRGEKSLIMKRKTIKRRRRQRGQGVDIQKWLSKTGIEFHSSGYQYLGPGTKLKKCLARGDPGINRLDRIAKQHDIDYARAKNLQDKWIADTRMIQSINKLPGKKTLTERLIRKIMQAKKRLKL